MRLPALAVLLLLPANLAAQPAETGRHPVPSVTAQGEAVINTEPDQAEIDIGVVTQANNALQAAEENAKKLARVMAAVKKLLGKGDQVKTASYSLTPNYRYPQGGKPEIVGYTATNVLHISTGSLTGVGKLIDASMQEGANNVNRLTFTLKDEQTAQLEALRLAARKAKTKTDEIAAALGLKIVRILSVTEGERAVRPLTMALARGSQMNVAAAAPTPVEAGTIEIRSSVTLTAELGTK